MASNGFIDDLMRPTAYHLDPAGGCPAGSTDGCLRGGVVLDVDWPGALESVETAWSSLRRVLSAKGVVEAAGGYPIRVCREASYGREEYSVSIDPTGAALRAADADGLRRAIYFLEDRLCEARGPSATAGTWRRRPFVKHRISRCFFGPTYRPPKHIDELSDDIDYYPEAYLDKLAHEGVNGLWLTMYFRDLPSSLFPAFGAGSARRFSKLRQTVARCARYGIRIYVFFSEPKGFGKAHHTIDKGAVAPHPEVAQPQDGLYGSFCTSTVAGRQYLEESLTTLFREVPDLGGVINIMLGEDNGSCVAHGVLSGGRCVCPRCAARPAGEIYRELGEVMGGAIHRVSPDAEFIGWFYAPGSRDGSPLAARLAAAMARWPDDCGVMVNFESGARADQLGKPRTAFDYSLAFLGPSELFRQVAGTCRRVAAKLQVGCSHENATVPFIPVPGNLYEKYRAMHDLGVYAAMQCWYFGNYPGLMNRAAGELSFEPFPETEEAFLTALARPVWREHASREVRAWQCFAAGYRQFPTNLAFEWYGPLHDSIAWPLHLVPVDAPIAPSWIFGAFPTVSGDRIGECLNYQHTLDEAISLCQAMAARWQEGVELMAPLRQAFAHDPARLADIDLAEAIGLQMHSTCNLLRFYSLREAMFYEQRDHLAALRAIVVAEMANVRAMAALCERDPRLGYHSEAEGYRFDVARLNARLAQLERLLAEEFAGFRLEAAFCDAYTGRRPAGPSARCGYGAPSAAPAPIGAAGLAWNSHYDDTALVFHVHGAAGRGFGIEIEPCRMWSAIQIRVDAAGACYVPDVFFRETPVITSTLDADGVRHVAVPMALFDGYRRPGFPMRVNLWSGADAWVERRGLPARLMHSDFNPACVGWLVLEPPPAR